MKTFEITKENLGEPICEGYKAIKWDGTTKGSNKFCYAAENEELVGRAFSVNGEIKECKWGLHFSKKPEDVFSFYEPLGFNRYFKVKAYGKTVDSEDEKKTVAQTIEFVEEYDLMQFICIIKNFKRDHSNGNNDSNGNNCSNGNNHSNGNNYSDGNNYSSGNNCSDGNNHSNGNNCSNGNNHSDGSSNCYGLYKCKGSFNSAFCFGKNGIANEIFNKKVDDERAKEIIEKLKGFGYYPKWLTIAECKGNKDWWAFNWEKLKVADTKTAWADMPGKMLDYIKSLLEYDDEIFKKITEGDDAAD